MGQIALTSVAFIIFEAKSMFDFGFGLLTVFSAVYGIVMYLLLIWQCENTFNAIETCERFIQKSKIFSPYSVDTYAIPF